MKPFINKLLLGVTVCCLGCFSAVADAEAPTEQLTPSVKAAPAVKPSKDYTACLTAWDSRLNTLQTLFTQETKYDGTLISQSQGRLRYAKQGSKLRLDTLENKEVTQSAVTDKKQIYILDEKGKEISTISWKDWLAGQPNQALFDFGNYTALLAKHTVTVTEQDTKQAVLRLTPKKQTDPYTLYVTINAENCFPRSISIESELMTTTAQLQDPQINTPLAADSFKGLK